MLETIFFPNNAIHDGGVIIKGDRIAYAACIFPLTQRQDLNKSLGTRHRAAIGLSEETDAVIVVVSEETGMISHAYKGQLVRGVTLEELRAFLTSVLLQPAKSHNVVEWLRARFGEPPQPRPGGHHQATNRARRPKPNRQIIISNAMRDWFIKDLGWKLFSAGSGRGHLADRHQIRESSASPVAVLRAAAEPGRRFEQSARAHRVRRRRRARIQASAPTRSPSPSAARPTSWRRCRQDRFTRLCGSDRHRRRARPAQARGCLHAARRDSRQRGTAER